MLFLMERKKKLQSEIDPILDQHTEVIDEQASTLAATLPIVKSDCKLLEETEKKGSKEAIFAAGIKVSKNLEVYEMALTEMEKEMKTFSLTFKLNTNLEGLIKQSKLLK